VKGHLLDLLIWELWFLGVEFRCEGLRVTVVDSEVGFEGRRATVSGFKSYT
jgi:hypothetical protein